MDDLERNKMIVTAYVSEAIIQRRPAEAVEKYVGAHVRQHNPNATDGPEAIVQFMTALVTENPDLQLDAKRVIAEGDLVVTHSLIRTSPDDRGHSGRRHPPVG